MPGWCRCLIVTHRCSIAYTVSWTPGGEHGHERSRPQYRSDAGEPALRGKDPRKRIVPLAGGARQTALPHARRRTRIRRTKGKPERAPARPVHREAIAERKQIRALLGDVRRLLQAMK